MTKKEKKKMQERLRYKGKIPPHFILFKGFCYHGGNLNSGEFECWAALRSFRWDWDENNEYVANVFPHRETLALMMGVTERTVTNRLKGLRKNGLLNRSNLNQYSKLYLSSII